MHLQTHLMASWALGAALPERRDRRLVAWSGVVSDLDGLSVLWGEQAYARWHHVLTHGLAAAVATTVVVAGVAHQRTRTAALAFVAFHSHLLLDVLGSGVGWTVTYLYPVSDASFGTALGWELASWQNLVFTALMLGVSLRAAVVHHRSFVESCAPVAIDATFCALVERTWRRMRTSVRGAD